jgi:single-strand DNA-binding protein
VNLSVATDESWVDKGSGERKTKTEWHRVSITNDKTAAFVEQYVKKGSLLYIEGQIETRKWTDKDGQDKYSTEIVVKPFRGELTLLDSKGSGDGERSEGGGERQPAKAAGGGVGGRQAWSPSSNDLSDEIPFSPEWR